MNKGYIVQEIGDRLITPRCDLKDSPYPSRIKAIKAAKRERIAAWVIMLVAKPKREAP